MNSVAVLGTGEWLDPPPTWQLGDDALTLETGLETDFCRATLHGFIHDDSHALLVPVSRDFTAYLIFDGD